MFPTVITLNRHSLSEPKKETQHVANIFFHDRGLIKISLIRLCISLILSYVCQIHCSRHIWSIWFLNYIKNGGFPPDLGLSRVSSRLLVCFSLWWAIGTSCRDCISHAQTCRDFAVWTLLAPLSFTESTFLRQLPGKAFRETTCSQLVDFLGVV